MVGGARGHIPADQQRADQGARHVGVGAPVGVGRDHAHHRQQGDELDGHDDVERFLGGGQQAGGEQRGVLPDHQHQEPAGHGRLGPADLGDQALAAHRQIDRQRPQRHQEERRPQHQIGRKLQRPGGVQRLQAQHPEPVVHLEQPIDDHQREIGHRHGHHRRPQRQRPAVSESRLAALQHQPDHQGDQRGSQSPDQQLVLDPLRERGHRKEQLA